MWVHELSQADATCGGKAVGLAKLIRAGLPVPAGFVIDDRAFRHLVGELDVRDEAAIGHVLGEAAQKIMTGQLPTELVEEVQRRAAALGDEVIVRSSATIEDGEAGAAAGVFSSREAVPVGDVWDAIRGVWMSALTPLAAAYARRRGGVITIGVIVQQLQRGERITVYTRPPGQPTGTSVMIQREPRANEGEDSSAPVGIVAAPPAGGEEIRSDRIDAQIAQDVRHPDDPSHTRDGTEARDAGAPTTGAPDESNEGGIPSSGTSGIRPGGLVFVSRDVPSHASEERNIATLALRAEAAIGATAGADVELVGGMVVQARPIVHPVARPRTSPPPSVIAPLVADGRVWTWDIAHNPDPLSTAQAELVERVERASIAPWSLRVCAGFLYSAPREDTDDARRSAGQVDANEAADHVVAPRSAGHVDEDPASLNEHVARIERRLARALETSTITHLTDAPVPDPAAELADAIARYLAFYAIWANELAPLISRLRSTRGTTTGARPSSVEATLAAAARGEINDADVLDRIGAMAPAWDVAVPTYAERPHVIRAAIERARSVPAVMPRALDVAADLAERDDVWFARAQAMVRRALLARADELGIEGDDACWLPFEALESGIAPEEARRRASAARSAAERASRWAMPIVVGGEPPVEGEALRGVGTGPRVVGRVVRFASLGSAVAVSSGDVVVTRAVTPALAVLVIGCAALISETGGLLDHGAALARELGIPCVVGCHDAWTLLADGMLVTVDGDAGTVTPTH